MFSPMMSMPVFGEILGSLEKETQDISVTTFSYFIPNDEEKAEGTLM